MPWTAAELNILREGLYSLEKFWTPSSFPYLFTPIAIRRVGIGSVGSAALRIADPYHLHSMPVIELDNNTFGNPLDTNNVIGVLWGEMYHYMDYILSGRPAIWFDSSDQQANTQLMYDVCFSQSTHSSRFASAAGWNIFQCQASFGVGILKDTNLIINSPANLVEGSGNYAAKGVHEDFAHTYQVLTQALIGGQEVCTTGFFVDICLKSNVLSSMVQAHSNFWVDDKRLQFFLNDATLYRANISTYYQFR